MGDETAIAWCEHTFNPWWGCDEAEREPGAPPDQRSPECLHCYARTWDRRLGGEHWGATAPRRLASESYWAKPLKWNAAAERAGVRARVFCASMSDWAERHADPEVNARLDVARAGLWQLVRATPWLDWLMLTKRAERLAELLPWMLDHRCDPTALARLGTPAEIEAALRPWPNVWVGVTCGARSSLWRIAMLRRIRAAVRFVSAEPLLDRITAEEWDRALAQDVDIEVAEDGMGGEERIPIPRSGGLGRIHWLIVGDESGNGKREIPLDAIRDARDAAVRHGVAFHLKQWNGPIGHGIDGDRKRPGDKIHLPVLDGRRWDERPRGH